MYVKYFLVSVVWFFSRFFLFYFPPSHIYVFLPAVFFLSLIWFLLFGVPIFRVCVLRWSNISVVPICPLNRRLLATTPCIRERFWHVADFLIDQINALNSIIQSQRTQKMTANISCQLSLTECGKQKVKAMTHRSSKLDILINDK